MDAPTDPVLSVVYDVFGYLLLAAFLIAVGWLSGRILGVRRGFGRAVVAGLVGFVSGQILVAAQFGSSVELDDLGDLARLGFGFVGYVLLVTMLASIVLDVVLRPRPRRRRLRVPHPIRALRARLSTVGRLRDIARAAHESGLYGPRLGRPPHLSSPKGALALRQTLEHSGGMLVKFGQIASTRDDLLPATLTAELANLRTAVPPLSADEVEAVIVAETGKPLGATFASFDLAPLAAASIGVTHRAVLLDGRHVIVKVQRPRIEQTVDRDGRVLRLAARQLERRSDSAEQLGVSALVDELIAGVEEELDFRREAANNAVMRRNRSQDQGVRLPEIYQDLTTRRVLVMDEVDGVPVSDQDAVAATGVPRRQIADNLLRSFFRQVLKDGVYHADPHAGNVLIGADGVIWLIDFGAVGHIDPITLEALQQLAAGFSLRDPSMLARAVRRMAGVRGEGLDMNAMEFDLGVVLTDVSGGGFDPKALQEVVLVLKRHGVPAPSALTVLGRAALTLDGTLREIDPTYRMAEQAQTMLPELVDLADMDPRRVLTSIAMRSVPALKSLPQLTEDLALQARSGRFTIRTDRYSGADGVQVGRWIDDVTFAALGMAGLVGSALLLVAAGLVGNSEIALYLRLIGFTGLIASSAMQMRAVAQILSRRPRDGG